MIATIVCLVLLFVTLMSAASALASASGHAELARELEEAEQDVIRTAKVLASLIHGVDVAKAVLPGEARGAMLEALSESQKVAEAQGAVDAARAALGRYPASPTAAIVDAIRGAMP